MCVYIYVYTDLNVCQIFSPFSLINVFSVFTYNHQKRNIKGKGDFMLSVPNPATRLLARLKELFH